MKKWVLISLPFVAAILLYFHDIPTDLTEEDKKALAFYGNLNNTDHLDNVQMVETLLDQMQILIRKDYGIPKGQSREPKDLVRFRTGKCYDWCRTSYKFFKYHNIPVKYFGMFALNGNILNIMRPGVPSHCALEIEMNGSWIYVDPFYGWVAKDHEGKFIDVKQLLSSKADSIHSTIPDDLQELLDQKSVAIYGLYSRHGRFYPPFTLIPDYSYSEFKLNF